MSVKRIAWLVPSIACVVAAFAQPLIGAPQGPAKAVPDITGSWERYRGAPRAAGAAQRPDPYAPPQAPPAPLKPAAMKEWQAKMQAVREADAKGQPLAAGVVRCLPEGMPTMMGGPFPIEILQSKGQVTIIEEAYTQVRRILLDRPPQPVEDVEPGFYGHSVGRWDGDTLVVDTIGVKESVRYQNMPHSKAMRIRERIKLVSPEILWDEITIEDSATLEKPWTFTYALKRMPDYTLLEYICEDNREYADEKGVQRIRIDPPAR
jgi:hypothetical protein